MSTEPPYWYYPIRQSLAAALLQAGRHAEAKQQFDLRCAGRPPTAGRIMASPNCTRRAAIPQRRARPRRLAKTWIGDRKLLQVSNL